jgi:ribose 5-phosphate isomerase
VDAPYRTAPVAIIFDYGIDNIRTNLQYIKTYSGGSVFSVNDMLLHKSIERSILMVEDQKLEKKLEKQVIELWHVIQDSFTAERKPKQR